MRIAQSPADLGFNHHDEPRLKKALTQAEDKRTFQRVQAVLLVARGHHISEVASISGVSEQTIYNWVHLYLDQHKVAALEDDPRSGRPLAAQRITAARILRELRRSPLKLGYRTNVWTVETLAHHLSERYNCLIRPRTLRRRMKEAGLVCTRPRYLYSERDPHRAQKKGPLSEG
jgi:transposase